MDKVDLLLSKLDKKQLADFIRKECSHNKAFQDRFLALGMGTVFRPDPESYAARVEDLMGKYSGRRGYIEYGDTFGFNQAVSEILAEADEAIEKEQWDVAVAILTGISSVAEDIINSGDDSAGELSAIVDECFEKWILLCSDDSLPENVKNEILDLALSRFNENDLKGCDWRWSWMQMAVDLADTQEKQNRVLKALDAIPTDGDDWHSRYELREAQNFKLELMSKYGSPEDQVRFMYDNLSNSDFRQRLIQIAWDKSDYAEVLRLAEDGITHDADYAGLVSDWLKWEYKAYHKMGDKANELRMARHFFFNEGRWGGNEFSMDSMYSALKSLVPRKEWEKYVRTLISEARDKEDIPRLLFIYTQEKMWPEYMDYIYKIPTARNIDDAPAEVKKLYRDEIVELYAAAVRNHFLRASGRDSYCEGVGLLRNLIAYGGTKEAERIVAEQKSRTPRRPALIDELSKL